MSKFYTVSLQNETIIFTAAFEKKLNNGNKEAYDLYVETKAKFPTFKIEVEEAKKRVGKYDHTTMDDIEAYIGDDEHKEWKVEFDKLFGEKIPSKTNSTKSVRKVKFAVIRKWFVEKREKEEEAKAQKEREAAARQTPNRRRAAPACARTARSQSIRKNVKPSIRTCRSSSAAWRLRCAGLPITIIGRTRSTPRFWWTRART